MSEQPPMLLLASGGRVAHGKLGAEETFRTKMEEGFDVYTELNNVVFRVSLNEDDTFRYTPLQAKPAGL